MEFELTSEQSLFAESVHRFAAANLADGSIERAHDPRYPWPVAELLASQGLMGLSMPTEIGGQGGTLMDAVLAIEQVARSCPKSADIVQAGNFGAIRTFAEFATSELRDRFLPDLLAGRSLLALCMSEPEAGSAVTELATTAVQDGDDLRVTGTKVFSTHSMDATAFLVYVRFGPGVDGIGSIIVERDAAGLTFGGPQAYMSGERWCQLYFDECRVPAANIVVGAGGFRQQISAFNVERIGNAARSLALGRLAFTAAVEYATQRKQFGKPLCEFQGLQWKMADIAVELDSAQLLLYRAAVRAERQLPSAYETAAAKLACNQTGFDAANEALQVMGAYGYGSDSLVEYCLRRTRGWMIAGGTLEMLRNRLAEDVFDRRFDQRA